MIMKNIIINISIECKYVSLRSFRDKIVAIRNDLIPHSCNKHNKI